MQESSAKTLSIKHVNTRRAREIKWWAMITSNGEAEIRTDYAKITPMDILRAM